MSWRRTLKPCPPDFVRPLIDSGGAEALACASQECPDAAAVRRIFLDLCRATCLSFAERPFIGYYACDPTTREVEGLSPVSWGELASFCASAACVWLHEPSLSAVRSTLDAVARQYGISSEDWRRSVQALCPKDGPTTADRSSRTPY